MSKNCIKNGGPLPLSRLSRYSAACKRAAMLLMFNLQFTLRKIWSRKKGGSNLVGCTWSKMVLMWVKLKRWWRPSWWWWGWCSWRGWCRYSNARCKACPAYTLVDRKKTALPDNSILTRKIAPKNNNKSNAGEKSRQIDVVQNWNPFISHFLKEKVKGI